jgi:hypothetical protein
MRVEMTITKKQWCVFRNLVHAVYREARHLGPAGDQHARVTVSTGPLQAAALRCKANRSELKTARLYTLTSNAETPGAVVEPYRERTGLGIDDLVSLFSLPNWVPSYGGQKWKRIATTLREFAAAIEAGDTARIAEVVATVETLAHNGGSLIPSQSQWDTSAYLREKWPELCL